MPYNPKYYEGGKVSMQKGRHKVSLKTYSDFPDNTLVAIFQGVRGTKPELDFVVKILVDGIEMRPITPSHAHIATDLLIKSTLFPQQIKSFMVYYLQFYDSCNPFSSKEERDSHELETLDYIRSNFREVKVPRTLSIETLGAVLELFCYCEKQNSGAHQFRQFLVNMINYADGNLDYIRVINLATKFREY